LKEYAKELEIKRIVLTDHSIKKCYGESIKFADMYTLLYGITWYTSRGFLPYDQIAKNVDNATLVILNNNKTIIKTTYVKDIKNLNKILVKYGKLSKDDAQTIIEKHYDKKMYRFFENMLKGSNNEDLCILFHSVYQYVMIDLGVQTMYGKTFFMEV
jgi:hypothetical protein